MIDQLDTLECDTGYLLPFSFNTPWILYAGPGMDWLGKYVAHLFTLQPIKTRSNSHHVILYDTKQEQDIKNSSFVFRHDGGSFYAHSSGDLIAFIPSLAKTDPFIRSIGIKALVLFIYLRMITEGALILHAALLVRNDKAIIIAAKSGGGKTTTSSRVPSPWHSPSDEHILLIPEGSGYRVSSLPTFSRVAVDKTMQESWDCTRFWQLEAVFFLKKGEATKISKMHATAALSTLRQSAYESFMYHFRRSGVNNVNRTCQKLLLFASSKVLTSSVPVYELNTCLSDQFWIDIEVKLWGLNIIKTEST